MFYNIHRCDVKTMCYIVFISHSLHSRYIKIAFRKYVIKFFLDIFNYCFSILFHRYLNVVSSVNSRKVIPIYLNPRGYTCDFLLALATRHPQSCPATEVKGVCKCRQVSPTSATCCKKINSMNILQHCPSDFVTETPLATRATFWFHDPCNIRK